MLPQSQDVSWTFFYLWYRHIMENNHSIDWKNSSFFINNKNKEVLQMVECARILKLPNFNLSSGFYSLLDNIVHDIAQSPMIPSCILTSRFPSLLAFPFHYSLCFWSSCLDDIVSLDPFSFKIYFLLFFWPDEVCRFTHVLTVSNKKSVWFYKHLYLQNCI